MHLTKKLTKIAILASTLGFTVTTTRADGFTERLFWAAYDPGSNGVGSDPDGYDGAVFDGRYVYFVPRHNGYRFHGEVLRYDTGEAFDNVSAWSTYDYGAACGEDCTDPNGYIGAVFDGRYVYFAPANNGTEYHGEVLRYDTTGGFGDTVHWDWVTGFHNVESGVGEIHDGNLRSGDATSDSSTVEVTFHDAFLAARPMPGNVYPYYCIVYEAFGTVGSVTVAPHACAIFDTDDDGDVDLVDFGNFQVTFSDTP